MAPLAPPSQGKGAWRLSQMSETIMRSNELGGAVMPQIQHVIDQRHRLAWTALGRTDPAGTSLPRGRMDPDTLCRFLHCPALRATLSSCRQHSQWYSFKTSRNTVSTANGQSLTKLRRRSQRLAIGLLLFKSTAANLTSTWYGRHRSVIDRRWCHSSHTDSAHLGVVSRCAAGHKPCCHKSSRQPTKVAHKAMALS